VQRGPSGQEGVQNFSTTGRMGSERWCRGTGSGFFVVLYLQIALYHGSRLARRNESVKLHSLVI